MFVESYRLNVKGEEMTGIFTKKCFTRGVVTTPPTLGRMSLSVSMARLWIKVHTHCTFGAKAPYSTKYFCSTSIIIISGSKYICTVRLSQKKPSILLEDFFDLVRHLSVITIYSKYIYTEL